MKREIKRDEYTCDRCGYVDSAAEGWLRRKGVDLCPGCDLDLLRFLNNEPVEPMYLESKYRHADPDLRAALRRSLGARGVHPYGPSVVPLDRDVAS